MYHERRILTNTLSLTLGRVAGDLFAFLFIVQFARAFGAELLGQYSLGMALGAVLAIFVSCGLNLPLIRDLSCEPQAGPRYVGNVLLAQAVFAMTAWLVLYGIAATLEIDAQGRAILLLLGSYQLIYRFSLLTRVQFSASQQMHYPALLEATHKACIWGLGAIGIYAVQDPLVALSAYPVSGLALLVVGWALAVRHFGWPSLRPEFGLIMVRLRSSLSFFVTLLVAEVYARLGIVLLSRLGGDQAVGMYSSAERLTVVVAIVFAIFGGSVLPVMSKLWAESQDQLTELYRRCLRILIVVTIPLATLIFLLRDWIIGILYGEGFESAAGVLGVLAGGLVFLSIKELLFSLMLACNRQRDLLKIYAVGLGFFLALVLFVLPSMGAIGLAWCTLASDVLFIVLGYRAVAAYMRPPPVFRVARGPMLAASIVLSGYYLLNGFPLPIRLGVAMTLGAVGMWLFRAVAAHDLRYLRHMLASTISRPALDEPPRADARF